MLTPPKTPWEMFDRPCPLVAFQRVVAGKYKLRLLWALSFGPMRYGDLRRSLVAATMGDNPTPRTLSRELKELAARGLITRTEYPGVPPKVEYRLTPLGESIQPLLLEIGRWGVTQAEAGSRAGQAGCSSGDADSAAMPAST